MQRYYNSGGTLTEDPSQRTYYYYDTNPFNSSYSQYAAGRLAAVQYSGGNCSSYTVPMSGCDTIEEWYSYSSGGAVVGKWLHLNRGSANGDLSASWTYDNEGRATGVTYPSWTSGSNSYVGSNYTYAMDTMGRLNTMTDTLNTHTLVTGTSFGPANELLSLSGSSWGVNSETRTYNSRLQLTNLNVGYSYAVVNTTYGYSSLNDNGKIAAQTDAISGEQVVYTYDALNRLATAVTSDNPSVTQWGQSYTYDGFGNLLDQTIIKGAGPSESTTYDPTTNRQTGETTDANGNIGSGNNSWNNVFDIENRLVHPASSSAYYAYDPGNKRVWRGDSSVSLDEIDFWSGGGRKLGAYQLSVSGSTIKFTMTTVNAYFGGKLVSKGVPGPGSTSDNITLGAIAADRLGSIGKFYPYGQEKPSATTNDTEKFTGYFRDAATGLDYADQRYHQPGMGRFMTPDRYSNSAGPADPGGWNRYAYTRGDPVNRVDRGGTCDVGIDGLVYDPNGCYGDYNGGAGEDGEVLIAEQESQPVWGPSCPAGLYFAANTNSCVTIAAYEAGNPQSPPQLSCSFTNFAGSAAPVAGTYGYGTTAFDGYGLPTNFTFSAVIQGGTGSYTGPFTWTETQSVTRYTRTPTGAIRDIRRGQDSPLFWDIRGSLTPPTTPSAQVFDAPATVGLPAGSTVNWIFNLQVTVSWGGQTVNCPDVLWSAQISFDSSGSVSGSSWSDTQPTH